MFFVQNIHRFFVYYHSPFILKIQVFFRLFFHNFLCIKKQRIRYFSQYSLLSLHYFFVFSAEFFPVKAETTMQSTMVMTISGSVFPTGISTVIR